jgi:glutamate synthase (NADPH) large chain
MSRPPKPQRRLDGSAGPQGLYHPDAEHDSCGLAFVATLSGIPTHDIVSKALVALRNMEHRGASGSEPDSGDGAGILLQVPDAFLREVVRESHQMELPAAGSYAVGVAFLPPLGPTLSADEPQSTMAAVARIASEEGLRILCWRELPTVPDGVGATARSVMPQFRQLFVTSTTGTIAGMDLERLAFCLRKRAEHELGVYFPSLSGRTLVYKGMLTTGQLESFFPDLSDHRLVSSLALVHSRFSTNTFPSWPLAHPYRFVAHNGEINTVVGNRNWMRARESQLTSDLIPGDLDRLLPICSPGASDSTSFDEVLELLHLSGRSLPHAVLMMIPEAWQNHTEMDPARRAFYQFHSTVMEPWDGPACVAFTDGELIGAVLDRNGLRPSRFWVTDDGLVVLASEVGVLDVDPARIIRKGRLQPGRMFLVDTTRRRIVEDDEVKAELASQQPYADWLHAGSVKLHDLPDRDHVVHTRSSVVRRQQAFGYTEEELQLLLTPMATTGTEPIGSMGSDTPLAVLSTRPRLLFDYFTQIFAQVTNPPLDSLREELVTSLASFVGPEINLLGESPQHCRQVGLPFPVIDNDDLAKLRHINADGNLPGFEAITVSCLYSVAGGGPALRARLAEICSEVSDAVAVGARFVVLSDRDADSEFAAIPSLLATAAVHHHLVRERERTRVGLLVEAGDVREVHHVALLVGYGAAAVNPYLAMETVEDLARSGALGAIDAPTAIRNLITALGKGVLKVMSKMGISTVASYRGAQVFECLGISTAVIDSYFTGTPSRLGGIGLDVIAAEVAQRHAIAYPHRGELPGQPRLNAGGEYQWRRDGELHLFNPDTVFRLQHSTRTGRYEVFKEYTRAVDNQAESLATLRGLFRFREGARVPIPLAEVEPAADIIRRFSTGAMSYGSISAEAHETLAVAMNRLGGKSNTGEGGEDPERYLVAPDGSSRRSAIKQVASGRFGVTSEYLTNADDIQIKMAQGAKPGEGGQLPGHKVYPWIARTRYSTPGVGLISPPPHHDIYSIEDLAQLIHDLKNANPSARVHVKLVAEVGVGTVAAGVSKAHADVVLISGHDGGTGASPLTSLKHAGSPWELGLAETQQTLLRNGLRDRIVVQADGQLKTGRDVIIAALLGAEEFGFATAPLVVSGCVMMRVCHLDTCPVGVATQNPELRKRFTGRPEFVITFFEFIAEEVREYLAALGFRTLDEAIGRVDALDTEPAVTHWKAAGLDLGPIFAMPSLPDGAPRRRMIPQDHGLEKAMDNDLIEASRVSLEQGLPVRIARTIRNVHRTVGTMLGHEVTRRYGGLGLPEGTIDITLSGSAGQSFGAFLPRGITLRLLGDANDFVGKGLSGGMLIVRPAREAVFIAAHNVIAGNVLLYGATGGKAYVRGLVGERFGVRNSGARAVVEGVGDHGCEYMTGGTVVVLGPTGRNFAAGMSGGTAYLLDAVPGRVNGQLVDLEPLSDPGVTELVTLVTEHAAETESSVAAEILAGFMTDPVRTRARFTAVVPRDYRRVLLAQEVALSEGYNLDDPVVFERMMESSRG